MPLTTHSFIIGIEISMTNSQLNIFKLRDDASIHLRPKPEKNSFQRILSDISLAFPPSNFRRVSI